MDLQKEINLKLNLQTLLIIILIEAIKLLKLLKFNAVPPVINTFRHEKSSGGFYLHHCFRDSICRGPMLAFCFILSGLLESHDSFRGLLFADIPTGRIPPMQFRGFSRVRGRRSLGTLAQRSDPGPLGWQTAIINKLINQESPIRSRIGLLGSKGKFYMPSHIETISIKIF